MNKNIRELSEKEAEEILEFVYPNETPLSNPKKYNYWFTGLSFDPVLGEDGKGQQVTFGLRPIIGIQFRGGANNDGMILHFDNSKVMLWLYRHGYDIDEFLESNQHNTDRERDMENFSDEMYIMILRYEKDPKHYTIESAINNIKECLERYVFKD